jgi:hypothetical protein
VPSTRAAAFEWLLALSQVTAGGQAGVSDKLGLYADLLAGEFPSSVFSMEALRAVSTGDGKGFFPPVDTVRRRLTDFMAKIRAEAFVGPSLSHLSIADAHWVGVLRDMIEGRRRSDVRHWLLFVEAHYPQAFATLRAEFGADRLAAIVGGPAIEGPAAGRDPKISREVARIVDRTAEQTAKKHRLSAPRAPERSVEEQLAALKKGASR